MKTIKLYTCSSHEAQWSTTYGLVGDKTNMDEYGSIGFGPSVISSSSFLASSFFLFWKVKICIKLFVSFDHNCVYDDSSNIKNIP